MSPTEAIARSVTPPSMREQIELARQRQAQRTPEQLRQRHEILARTHGALSEEDGEIFEQAMLNARRLETFD